ncbi:hypothetical protein [Winogradskyella sp.]|uniref:hypothetical protein n=1 Tax=Winogradskyella sp. TaxID=1883156 RepID=UPI002619A3FF|nr:hypothetical protein [Winogradskyella sp.]
MKTKNWISVLGTLKVIAILVWAFAFLSSRLGWFDDSEIITQQILKNLKYLGIILYLILYLFELRLTVKQKDTEIAKLKTKLLEYER